MTKRPKKQPSRARSAEFKRRSAAAKKGWETRRLKKELASQVIRNIRQQSDRTLVRAQRSFQKVHRAVNKLIEAQRETRRIAHKIAEAKSDRYRKYWAGKLDKAEGKEKQIEERIDRISHSFETRLHKQVIEKGGGIDAVTIGIRGVLEHVKDSDPKKIPSVIDDLFDDLVDWGYEEAIDETDIWNIYKEL